MDESQRAERIDEILEYYGRQPNRREQECMIEMLKELQEVNGCISSSLKEKAASAAGVKLSVIQVLVRLYPSLKEAPYQHEIIVCTGKACMEHGAGELLELLKQKLKIQRNGISKDTKVCVKTRSCLKQCRTAPNLLVDGQLYSDVGKEDILRMISRF